jgi:hypothetical protein
MNSGELLHTQLLEDLKNGNNIGVVIFTKTKLFLHKLSPISNQTPDRVYLTTANVINEKKAVFT